jgi:hypothetical protein
MPPQNANPVAQAQAAMHRTALLLARCSHHDSGIAPLFSAPLQDSDEESKFSLVRINDAVE